MFSGSQPHSAVQNTTNMVRWTIDFRTVNIDDVISKCGVPTRMPPAPALVARSPAGSPILPAPEDVLAGYDDSMPPGGCVRVQAVGDERVSDLIALARGQAIIPYRRRRRADNVWTHRHARSVRTNRTVAAR